MARKGSTELIADMKNDDGDLQVARERRTAHLHVAQLQASRKQQTARRKLVGWSTSERSLQTAGQQLETEVSSVALACARGSVEWT